jgi:predicted Zn-dependent peptidase
MARTAVVAGTATAVSSSVSNRMNRRDQDAYSQQAPQEVPMTGGDITAQLEKLHDMKERGVISEQDFESAKKKLIAG